MDREPLRCPVCGVAFALVVGRLGPCEDCERKQIASREAALELLSRPHPCEACGQLLTGRRRFCDGTCRKIVWRRRKTAAIGQAVT